LAETSVVRTEQARDTFAQEELIHYPIARRTRFPDTVCTQEREPVGDLIEASADRANFRYALALKIPAGAPVLLLEILRQADGHAMSTTTQVLSKDRFLNIAETYYRETRSG